jgi:hypothetical protein
LAIAVHAASFTVCMPLTLRRKFVSMRPSGRRGMPPSTSVVIRASCSASVWSSNVSPTAASKRCSKPARTSEGRRL